jgi:hypothetical protein
MSRKISSSSGGKPSIEAMTPGGMNWAYSVPPSTNSRPTIWSRCLLQSARIWGSSAFTGPGAKAGRMTRRAIEWKGGSDVMGGAPPIGAG